LNYSYIYINRLHGEEKKDLYDQLTKSVELLKQKEINHGSIHIYSDINDQESINFCRNQGLFNHPTSLSRKYYEQDSLIDILIEKTIQLKNFDQCQDVVLLDVDTLFLDNVPENFWDTAVFWKPEYYITQFRNLDKVLPKIPWKDVEINFDNSFIMYNTGVVFIPKKHRKEICEKALWITDYLNNGLLKPDDRYGSKLDEQIGLSIAVHDVYGRNNVIKSCENIIHHFWEEKTKNIKWWR
jgi:hypothetical protein